MGMDDYGDEDEVNLPARLFIFYSLNCINCTKTVFNFTGRHLCLISLVLLLSLPAGVAGVDRQDQRETGEEHQTAGSGGKTRKCS